MPAGIVIAVLLTSMFVADFVQIEDLPKIVGDLSSGQQSWENVINNYPSFDQQETG